MSSDLAERPVAPPVPAPPVRPRAEPTAPGGRPAVEGPTAARRGAARGPAPIHDEVERRLAVVLVLIGPLLIALSLPSFALQHGGGGAVVALPLVLAVLAGASVLGSLRRTRPIRRGPLLVAAVLALPLPVLARFGDAPETGTATPWLVLVAPVVIGAIALGVRTAAGAAVGAAAVGAGALAGGAGSLSPVHLAVVVPALTVTTLLVATVVRLVLRRADEADAAELAAAQRFEAAQRELVLEAERVRTDALLHDSVLTALLVAADARDAGTRERAVAMAHGALAVVRGERGGRAAAGALLSLERALAAVDREFAPMRAHVELDLQQAAHVVLPAEVADALVAAMLQALSNSIKHAGPYAARMVRAAPLGAGGVRITVRDDGRGFDQAAVSPERLGVRVSILERVRLVEGRATIRSAPGSGTSVVLEWTPPEADGTRP